MRLAHQRRIVQSKQQGSKSLEPVFQQNKREEKAFLDSHIGRFSTLEDTNDLYALAVIAESLRDMNHCKSIAQRMQLVDPKSPMSYGFIARSLLSNSELDQAEKQLLLGEQRAGSDSLECLEKLAPNWALLGMAFDRENQPKKSVECLLRYLQRRYEIRRSKPKTPIVLNTIVPAIHEQFIRMDDRAGYRHIVDALRELNASQTMAPNGNKADKRKYEIQLMRMLSDFTLACQTPAPELASQYDRILSHVLQNPESANAHQRFTTLALSVATKSWLESAAPQAGFEKVLEAVESRLSQLPVNLEFASKEAVNVAEGFRLQFQNMKADVLRLREADCVDSLVAGSREDSGIPKDGAQQEQMTVLCVVRDLQRSGKHVAAQIARIQKLRPGVPVVVTSGDTEQTLSGQNFASLLRVKFKDNPGIRLVSWANLECGKLQLQSDTVWLLIKNREIAGHYAGVGNQVSNEICWAIGGQDHRRPVFKNEVGDEGSVDSSH